MYELYSCLHPINSFTGDGGMVIAKCMISTNMASYHRYQANNMKTWVDIRYLHSSIHPSSIKSNPPRSPSSVYTSPSPSPSPTSILHPPSDTMTAPKSRGFPPLRPTFHTSESSRTRVTTRVPPLTATRDDVVVVMGFSGLWSGRK
ncbi:hypothetical protein EX30DRAFT_83852 [Ascodesmis nigricans]|uniref:Uncharacterized protein n=1 Tax=Ascodesmis nigricans TaxID=341454 RepID=A0A4S2N323_9PEZI|nr:hypothetical protein EX30DRAFT_83852 [Ascodesmis nigricans]